MMESCCIRCGWPTVVFWKRCATHNRILFSEMRPISRGNALAIFAEIFIWLVHYIVTFTIKSLQVDVHCIQWCYLEVYKKVLVSESS